jgi:hypothetical protein
MLCVVTSEPTPVPDAEILGAATRIADQMLDVRTRVNGQIDATLAEPHGVSAQLSTTWPGTLPPARRRSAV